MTLALQRVQVRDFDELKQNAYEAAMIGFHQNWNEVWRQNYLERFAPTKHQNEWRETIELYIRYIKKEISLDAAKESIQQIQDIYQNEKDRIIESMKGMMDFAIAITDAFEKVEEDVLEIEFTCPLCNGTAHANRVPQGRSRNGSRARRAKCRDCGYAIMT